MDEKEKYQKEQKPKVEEKPQVVETPEVEKNVQPGTSQDASADTAESQEKVDGLDKNEVRMLLEAYDKFKRQQEVNSGHQ